MKGFVGQPIDIVVMAAYFVFILGFGSVMGRYTRGTKDFFFGGQKFSWWLIAMSCVATVVGSYSFIKYSQQGFQYGMSATMTYLNDWFVLSFFIFGWLPIIYFTRVCSIPEYFERRFSRPVRTVVTVFILIYLLGYIGINLYTLGVAAQTMLGVNIWVAVLSIALVSCVYITAGGQTAVIMTDLVQGFLLLIAGFVLFFLGVRYVGGAGEFWSNLPVDHRLPFTGITQPEKFPAGGVFFQDGLANTLAFYFMNQGVMMRFMATKSVREGRKAILFVALILMPLATFAIANTGFVGTAMVAKGLLPADVESEEVFVKVAMLVCRPGIFGIIMAALIAALMSTIDTLVNASAAIFVNDFWRPYIRPNDTDRQHLAAARWFSILSEACGVLLVPVFMSIGTIYEAHAAFTAAVTPPVVVAILLGAFWRRYTPAGAMATLVAGAVCIGLSTSVKLDYFGLHYFSLGIGEHGYKFMRAFYGLVVSGAIGVVVSLLTKPAPDSQTEGFVAGTIKSAMRAFKGGEPDMNASMEKARGQLKPDDGLGLEEVRLGPALMRELNVSPGDLMYVSDARWWLGGLKSCHVKAAPAAGSAAEGIFLHPEAVAASRMRMGDAATVEKIL